VTKIESPTGIDLAPEPPSAVRVSKRAGLVGLLVLVCVVALVLMGMYVRHERQVELSERSVEEQKPTAAMPAEKELVNEIAPAAADRQDAAGNAHLPGSGQDEKNHNQNRERRSFAVPELKPPLEYRGAAPALRGNGPSELSAEEKLRVEAYQREREAIASPTMIKGSQLLAGGLGNSASQPQADIASDLAALARVAASRESGGLEDIASALRADRLRSRGLDDEEQNQQDQKEEFLSKASDRVEEDYLKSTRTPPLGKYEIKAGWDIPATLEQAVNSDLPGEVKALVRSNVYDTATGKYLLIPQGARLVGAYNSHVAYGQRGVQVVWSRIIFPDGSSLDLEGMTGYDAHGNAGFRYRVDNHYKRLVGFALLTSLFSAGVELAENGTGGSSVLATPNAAQTAAGAVGQQLGELGAEVTRRNLNVQPTIKIPIGYRFNVRVNRDVLFDAPYEPVHL
jgi:type IV secretory pathway VirB10-like protein